MSPIKVVLQYTFFSVLMGGLWVVMTSQPNLPGFSSLPGCRASFFGRCPTRSSSPVTSSSAGGMWHCA
ncbi:MAG: hypothetical protein MUF38_04155 [Anaerolineae bacterium]|nr:hypothetical protein [Anaerolineae bacterium]